MVKTRYSAYDVMARRHEWDDHTQQVIDQRMKDPGPPSFFTPDEAADLSAALACLLHDADPWRVGKVLEHIDNLLAKGPGDGYRPEHRAPDREFWRHGLAALGAGFAGLAPNQQLAQLTALQQQEQPFFKVLLKEAVSAYCALPPVWSYMGYGGPAFPRGYVRIELGLRDPWEANQDDE